MIETKRFCCEICGKEFKNRLECETHEFFDHSPDVEEWVIFFNRSPVRRISAKEMIECPISPDGIYIKNKKGIAFVKKFFDYLSLGTPWEEEFGDCKEYKGLYLWEDDYDKWIFPRAKIESYQKIATKWGVDV